MDIGTESPGGGESPTQLTWNNNMAIDNNQFSNTMMSRDLEGSTFTPGLTKTGYDQRSTVPPSKKVIKKNNDIR